MNRGTISIIAGRVVITSVGGMVWMTKREIAELFECFVAKVDTNVRVILKTRVLDEDSVCRRERYENGDIAELYNLEMIAALAFRIRSRNAELFRRWLMERAVKQPCPRYVPVFVPWSDNRPSN